VPDRDEQAQRLQQLDETLERDRDSTDADARNRFADSLVAKGILLAESERSDEAGRCFDAAVASFADDDDPALRRQALVALGYKAWMLGREGRISDAEAAFDDVVRRVGDASDGSAREAGAQALYNKGHMLRRAGRLEPALDAFRLVRRYGDSPDRVQSLVSKAMLLEVSILRDLQRPREAITCADEIVERFGERTASELREPVAKALSHKVHIAAEHDLREHLDSARTEMVARFGDANEPDIRLLFLQAMTRAGTYLEGCGRPDLSRKIYQDIVRRFPEPERPDIDELVTWTQERLGEFDKAIAKGNRQAAVVLGAGAAIAGLFRSRRGR